MMAEERFLRVPFFPDFSIVETIFHFEYDCKLEDILACQIQEIKTIETRLSEP